MANYRRSVSAMAFACLLIAAVHGSKALRENEDDSTDQVTGRLKTFLQLPPPHNRGYQRLLRSRGTGGYVGLQRNPQISTRNDKQLTEKSFFLGSRYGKRSDAADDDRTASSAPKGTSCYYTGVGDLYRCATPLNEQYPRILKHINSEEIDIK